jgi:hypothetical protein
MRVVELLYRYADRWAVENPVGIMSSRYRKPDQIIQPWQFGDNASKSTCLWLKGLPLLVPTKIIKGRVVNGRMRFSNQSDSGQNNGTHMGLSTSDPVWKQRSKTYQGIAKAMASQWSANKT